MGKPMPGVEQPLPTVKKSVWMMVIRWGGTLLSLALLIYLLERQGWADTIDAVRQVPWWVFVSAVALIFLSRVAVIGRWYVLLRSAHVQITVPQAVKLVFAGLFANNFLPSTVGGDVVRFAGSVRLKLNAPICAASLVMDRLVGSLGMLTVLPIGLVRFGLKPTDPSSVIWAYPVVGIASAGLLSKAIELAKKTIHSLLQAGKLWVTQPQAILLALAFTWMHMVLLFSTIWLLLFNMREPVSFWVIAGLYSMSYFITLLPVSVNGLGVQELSLTYLFSHYAGVSLHGVLALAILIRVLFMIASLPGVLYLPGLLQSAEVDVKARV